MNKLEIENKLIELKDCFRVEIYTTDNFIRNVYYSSIKNDIENECLTFDVYPSVTYKYEQITNIRPTPLHRVHSPSED